MPFIVNATVAAHPAMAASNVRFASADSIRIGGLATTSSSTRLPIVGAFLMAGLMLVAWPLDRRKRLIGAAMLVMVLAMSQVGCNGDNNSSPPPPPPVSSTITVTAASVSGGSGATTGLPLTIATVTAPQ